MNALTIGIIGSIVASILTYLFKENIQSVLYLIFRNIFPKVGGKWRVYHYSHHSDDSLFDLDEVELKEFLTEQGESPEKIEEMLSLKTEYDDSKIPTELTNKELIEELKEPDFYMEADLKQIANKVKGVINAYHDGKLIRTEEVNGRITPTRVMILLTEDKTEGHHNFGTILVKLSPDSEYMKGYETFLCTSCEDTSYHNVIMAKN